MSWHRRCGVVQLLSPTWLCNPVDLSRPDFPVLHCLLELLKLMSIDSVMLSNLLILSSFSSCLQSFPASAPFPMSGFFPSGGLSIRASASVLPRRIQGWFPLRWAHLISLQSKWFSGVFPSTTVPKHQFIGLWHLCSPALMSVHEYWKDHSFDYRDHCDKLLSLLFNTLSRFVIAFLPRSNHLLISWLQSPSAVIFRAQEEETCHCFRIFPFY